MGKIQMSRGKPIKLSTTLFVFYSQSFKVNEGSYFLGMGKVWRSNSNLGSHPFLENVFLDSWGSKCLEMHSQAIIHPCVCFLTQLDIARAFSLTIWAVFFIPPWLGISFLVWMSECAVVMLDLGVLRGHFSSLTQLEHVVHFPHVFMFPPHSFMPKNPFFVIAQ